MVNEKRDSGVSITLVIVAAIALAIAGGWAYMASRPREAPHPPGITEEAKAYVKNLKLSGVDMKATKAFRHHADDRHLDGLDAKCPADNGGVGVEQPRPERMADDGDLVARRRPWRIGVGDGPAHERHYPERFEAPA